MTGVQTCALPICALLRVLCERVLVPETAGVLSALGLAVSDERRDHVRSEVRPLTEVRDLPAVGDVDLRYQGQSFELTVPLGGDLVESFHAAHEERYGYSDRDHPIELVAVRTADVQPGPTLTLSATRQLDVVGPTVVELSGATCFVPDGWAGTTNEQGTLILERA